jgi:hypothetical protein
MSKTRSLAVLLVAGFFISFGATYSGHRAQAQGNQALQIDIPVKLEKANVVFEHHWVDGAGCANRAMWRDRCSQSLGQCRSASWGKSQHECNGARDPVGAAGVHAHL